MVKSSPSKGLQEVEAHAGGKVVSPTHRPPLPQVITLVLISATGSVNTRAIVRPESSS